MGEIMDGLVRQKIEHFLNDISCAFFVARFDIEICNNREVQRVGRGSGADPSTRVMLVIAYPWMTDSLEERCRSTVRLFWRRAPGFKNSSRVKVWHTN